MAEALTRETAGLSLGDTNLGGRIARVIDAAAGKYVWAESAPESAGAADIVDVSPAPLPTNLAQLQSSVNAANEPAGVAWQATVNTSGGYRLAQVIGGAWVYTDTGQESPVLDVVIRDVTPIPVPVDVTTLEGTVPAAGQPANEIWHATVGTPGAYQTAKIIGGVWDLTINDPAAADHNLQVVTKWENYINMDHATGNVLFDIQTNAGPFVILANPPTGISTVVVANNGTVDYSLRTGAVDNPSVVAGSPGSRDRDQDVEATTWTVLGGELIIGPGESRTLLVSRSTIPGLITIEPVTAPQAAVNPTVPPDPTAANQTAFPQLTTAELGGPMFRLDNGNLIGLREALAGWTAGASGRFVTAVNEPDVANLFDNDPNTFWSFASASWETLAIDYPSGNPEILRELHAARGRYDLTTNSTVSINVPTGFGAYTEQISATSPNPLFQAINNTTAAGPTAATSVGLVNGTGQREFVLELRAYVEDARDVSAAVTAGEVYEVTVPASNIDPSTDRIDHENPNTINGLYTATVVDGSGTLTLTPVAPQPGLATIDGTGFVTGDGLVRVPNEAALGTPAKGGVFGYAELEDSLWISNAAGTAWEPAGASKVREYLIDPTGARTDAPVTVASMKHNSGTPDPIDVSAGISDGDTASIAAGYRSAANYLDVTFDTTGLTFDEVRFHLVNWLNPPGTCPVDLKVDGVTVSTVDLSAILSNDLQSLVFPVPRVDGTSSTVNISGVWPAGGTPTLGSIDINEIALWDGTAGKTAYAVDRLTDGTHRYADAVVQASLATVVLAAGQTIDAELVSDDASQMWVKSTADNVWTLGPIAGQATPNEPLTIIPTPSTDTANTVVIPKVHNGAPLSAVEFKVGDRRPGQTGRRATETVLAADLTGTVARTVAMGALYFYEFAVTDGANDLTVDTTEIHGASPNTFGAMFEAVAYYQAAGASTFDELTDTDTAGLADGDGFRWDAATSRLVPARIEVWLGDTADTASRLALTASPGDEVYQIDKKQIWKLLRLPSTSNANWLKSGERTNPTTADSTSATSDSTAFTADVSA